MSFNKSNLNNIPYGLNKKNYVNQSQTFLQLADKENKNRNFPIQTKKQNFTRTNTPQKIQVFNSQTTTKNSQNKRASDKKIPLSKMSSSKIFSKTTFTSIRNSCSPNSNIKINNQKQFGRDSFKFLQKIGSGGFGQVWKVQYKKNSRSYAMKEISKAKVILKKSVHSILNQKEILINIYNPFIINMKCSFQDRQNLYLVLDYLTGGDLRYHLCSRVYFTQQQSKFLICCIILALQYIHENNIIHRDLKPENLVFQNTGYLRLTDFGIARKRKQKNAHQTSGTPGYMSPQVICRLNHSFQADYFALGVIAYQFMLRKRPYVGNSRKEIREHILAKQVLITKSEIPKNWSLQAADFINRLIQRKIESRLGFKGIQQIKKHPWLNNINWQKFKNKQYIPPFVPRNLCQTTQYLKQIEFESFDNSSEFEQQRILLRSEQIQDLFVSYNQLGSFKMYYGKDSTKNTFYNQHE